MFNREEISGFISNKFVKINQTIKEYSDLLVEFLEFVEREVSLFSRFYHVIHLTEKINEQNWFVIKVLKSVNLLFVEILHLMRSDNLIIV